MLYPLKRIAQPSYGDDVGFLVRARCPQDARRVVYDELLSEDLARINDPTYAGGRRPPHLIEMDRSNARTRNAMWLDPNQSTCVELSQDGPEEIILVDHLNG